MHLFIRRIQNICYDLTQMISRKIFLEALKTSLGLTVNSNAFSKATVSEFTLSFNEYFCCGYRRGDCGKHYESITLSNNTRNSTYIDLLLWVFTEESKESKFLI